MTLYFKSGNQYTVTPEDSVDVMKHLPGGTYTIKKNPMTEKLYLETTKECELPTKVYGNVKTRAKRVIETFHSRPKTTGVLLSGDKGSGKSLLAKQIASDLIQQNIPVIMVNEPWCGQQFNDMIASIDQPAMILFDEFDKVYSDEDDQTALLTLLDGVVESKKLFILTKNNGELNEYFINRPGRIYYTFNYRGLEDEFVREYATDNLINKSHVDSVCSVSQVFSMFSFDMLKAIIEEMNRYGESVSEVMSWLNVDVTQETTTYAINIMYRGEKISNSFYPYTLNYNPAFGNKREIELYFTNDTTFTDKDRPKLPELMLSNASLLSISNGGIVTFKFSYNGEDILVILERKDDATFNWGAF